MQRAIIEAAQAGAQAFTECECGIVGCLCAESVISIPVLPEPESCSGRLPRIAQRFKLARIVDSSYVVELESESTSVVNSGACFVIESGSFVLECNSKG